MRQRDFGQPGPTIQRPSRTLGLLMLCLVGLWLAFAVAINWAPASAQLGSIEAFKFLVGNTSLVARGQVWRLLTAPMVHDPGSVNHILATVLGLFFLAPALETTWGTPRLLRFLAVSVLFAYVTQMGVDAVLPESVGERLVPGHMWFGALPALEAVAIAFALNMRSSNVLLFFILPVGGRGLIVATIGISLALVVVNAIGPSGAIAPFAAMFAGWLFGGGTPSPARRWWLKWRLRRLESEVAGDRHRRIASAKSRFEVLPGGLKSSNKRRDLH
jgi:membrane associated rhomboid family serine protease